METSFPVVLLKEIANNSNSTWIFFTIFTYSSQHIAQVLLTVSSLVIRQKGESQNWCFKKTMHAKFSDKQTFLTVWYVLHYRLYCSCFISFPSVHTLLIMFHFYFLQFTVHLINFIDYSPYRSYLPYLFAFILHYHSTLMSVSLFNLINNLRVSLDKF